MSDLSPEAGLSAASGLGINGGVDPSRSPADRPRCAVPPPPGRAPCRYPAKAGTARCSLHTEYPGRRVDVTRWCAAWRPVLNAPCQSYVVPGAPFCAEYYGNPSVRMGSVEDDMALKSAPASGNGHRSPPTPPASSHRARSALPSEERLARAAIVSALGHSAGALMVLLHAAVEREQISWGCLKRVGEQEQFLTAHAGSLAIL
jgi:hypothetical protein